MHDGGFGPIHGGFLSARVTEVGADGLVTVELADGEVRAVPTLVPVTAMHLGREAVVAPLDDGRYLLVGLIQPPPSEPEVTVDGERAVLEAVREVVLRCGEASIVLHADGRIYIRGARIVSEASGANRIRGGSIQLN